MKKRILPFLLLFIGITTAFGQYYSPKTIGSSWSYKMTQGSFRDEILVETYAFNNKEYVKSVRTYSWGTIDTSYYRVDKKGSTYYLDAKSKTESMEAPAVPKIGNSWTSADKAWRYTIVELNSKLKTPTKTFKDCVVIKAEQVTNRDKDKMQVYLNYYVKGIGCVGSKMNNTLLSYIETWEVK